MNEHDASCVRDGHVIDPGPEWLLDVRHARSVCVDSCIGAAVEALWARGVVTLGSCCGHGDNSPTLVLAEGQSPMEACLALEEIDSRSWELWQWHLTDVTPYWSITEHRPEGATMSDDGGES